MSQLAKEKYLWQLQRRQHGPPFPPFTARVRFKRLRLAEDSWNTRDSVKVALAYCDRFTLEESLGVPHGPS